MSKIASALAILVLSTAVLPNEVAFAGASDLKVAFVKGNDFPNSGVCPGTFYGRVVSVDANPLGIGGAILIYIYRARSESKTMIPVLRRGALLIPPGMTNKHVDQRIFRTSQNS